MKKFILIILLIQPLLFTSLKAESGLEISPANNDLILKPGESYSGTFRLNNNNEFDASLEALKGYLDSNNKVSLDNFTNESPNWIRVDFEETILKSQHSGDYGYSIDIPSDAQEGVYRPLLVFKLSSTTEESGSVTSLNQLLPFQLNIFVSESGVYNGQMAITDLNVANKFLIGSDQVINYKLENKNSSPTKPFIRLQIVSPDNQIIYQTVQNESLTYLLNTNVFSNSLEAKNIFNKDMQLGRYSVEIFAKDLLTDKTISQKIYFWYIPQNILLLIVGVIIVLILMLVVRFWLKRNLGKKKKEKHLFMYK